MTKPRVPDMIRNAILGTACFLPMALQADPSLECSDAGSQVEIGACVQEAGKRVEAALVIAQGISITSAQELDDVTGRKAFVPALEASQSAWSAYREAHCNAVGASYGGGSGTGIAIEACLIELGRERIKELMSMAK
ncbi:lysozyme inhibitor LprI family protein [Tropicibacter sp. Alg240-R139]|uniref:lysozyme inhibitor LprI family protein n=1 Tax=Tropicibacter sp. Alg240-R139 TaxID=2305991 RepID=UPI001F0752A7|nr:lysozyme inhibitor LprI family protein [Tropicibacter sp. Alg240-R139]